MTGKMSQVQDNCSAQSRGCGGDDGITGKTDAQMQSQLSED